jgi:farnesyl-diphosphate farnesyltransferase
MTEAEILRRTSRTFHLTLRLLPDAVRGEASLGYLLARATDTLADSSLLEPSVRAGALRTVAASLGTASLPDGAAAAWAAAQRDPAERRLLEELPGLWARLAAGDAGRRGRLEPMLRTIIEGQLFDLERFTDGAPPLGEAELERYTQLVAGCVGEFWTDLCAAELPAFASAPAGEMRERGAAYGRALQLVNILRDRAMDAAVGRPYLEESAVPRWTALAREGLAQGGLYCEALRPGRLRYATLLPALLGFRALAFDVAFESHPLTPRKIPRREVRRWVWRALPAWWSAAAVGRLVREAREAPFRPAPSPPPRG